MFKIYKCKLFYFDVNIYIYNSKFEIHWNGNRVNVTCQSLCVCLCVALQRFLVNYGTYRLQIFFNIWANIPDSSHLWLKLKISILETTRSIQRTQTPPCLWSYVYTKMTQNDINYQSSLSYYSSLSLYYSNYSKKLKKASNNMTHHCFINNSSLWIAVYNR